MSKKLLVILGCVFVFGLLLARNAFAQTIFAPGQISEEIKALQKILSQDKSIYPEGLATGYYGRLTTRAIRRLQKKCGLPQTGIVDEKTAKCIFPEDYKITVISPNGGEEWDRSKLHTIKWDVTVTKSTEEETEEKFVPRYILWKKASIDLYRRIEGSQSEKPISVFVRHLATVNLFDKAWTWRITNDIPNGSNYVIRVSTGGRILLPIIMKGKKGAGPQATSWPIASRAWDESDEPFTITGTTPPPPGPSPDIQKAISLIKKAIMELEQAIRILEGSIMPLSESE